MNYWFDKKISKESLISSFWSSMAIFVISIISAMASAFIQDIFLFGLSAMLFLYAADSIGRIKYVYYQEGYLGSDED